MKNICFITQCVLPVPAVKGGAVETLVEYLLNENEKKGEYHFTVLSIDDIEAKRKSRDYKNSSFIYIPKGNKMINRLIGFIYRVLKHINIYIPFSLEFYKSLMLLKTLDKQDVFIYEAGPTSQIPAISKRVGKEKLFVHLHWDGMGKPSLDKAFSRLIPVSEYIGECWEKATNCNTKKIYPLLNCVDAECFDKLFEKREQYKLKDELDIPEDNYVIIFIGRMIEYKGIKELIQAYNMVNIDKTTLLLVGSSNFGAGKRTSFEKEIEDLVNKSNKNIITTGYIHQNQLYKYYSISDIAVMPSQFQEPAGLVALEAQITGTPLIATRVGGIPEFTSEKSTILVKQDECQIEEIAKNIEMLLLDSEKRKKMGENGRKFAKDFSVEKYYLKFGEILSYDREEAQ